MRSSFDELLDRPAYPTRQSCDEILVCTYFTRIIASKTAPRERLVATAREVSAS